MEPIVLKFGRRKLRKRCDWIRKDSHRAIRAVRAPSKINASILFRNSPRYEALARKHTESNHRPAVSHTLRFQLA